MPITRDDIDRAEISANGEIAQSLITVRRFRGANGYPASYGYYLRRAVFEPFGGEPMAVEPADVEDCDYPPSTESR